MMLEKEMLKMPIDILNLKVSTLVSLRKMGVCTLNQLCDLPTDKLVDDCREDLYNCIKKIEGLDETAFNLEYIKTYLSILGIHKCMFCEGYQEEDLYEGILEGCVTEELYLDEHCQEINENINSIVVSCQHDVKSVCPYFKVSFYLMKRVFKEVKL